MRLSDINTNRLLPRFCKNKPFIQSCCIVMDYIIHTIEARLVTLPLIYGGLESIQNCTDDELAFMAAEMLNAPYFPDLSREQREEIVLSYAAWTWKTGTVAALEQCLRYVFGGDPVVEDLIDFLHHYYVHAGGGDELAFKRLFNVLREDSHVTATPDLVFVELSGAIEQGVWVNGSLSYKAEGTINV